MEFRKLEASSATELLLGW